jgi:hypothetical protein
VKDYKCFDEWFEEVYGKTPFKDAEQELLFRVVALSGWHAGWKLADETRNN